LINRRHYLPRLLLTLSSIEKKRPAHLDRSLHINFRIAGDTVNCAPVGLKTVLRQLSFPTVRAAKLNHA
jgi:hypothetical protein